MRVTMVNKYYWPPHLGGVETQLHDVASGLASRPGIDVRAIVANESGDTVTETIDGVEVTRMGRTLAYSNTPVVRGMARAIRAEATRAEPADVLHLHFPYPWGEVSWLRAKAGLPTVLGYHSDIVRQKKALAAYRPLLERVLDRVDVIVTSSPNMVEYSEFLSSRAEKCRIVPYGIDVRAFEATPHVAARAQELRAGHERPIVLFVGRLVYYKGVDVLVKAMADVDADLVLMGRGPLEGELRELAVAHRVADRITWLPPQADAEKIAWYHAADVFALPSVERSEAFGLVQLEAHASGTPVVSTDLTTSVPFVNQDGFTGLTVPAGDVAALADALRRLCSDATLRDRLGSQARERAWRDFTIERMVNDTVRIYDDLLGITCATRDPSDSSDSDSSDDSWGEVDL